MTDFMSDHRPSPEFRASLEREIARAFRSETQFGHSRRTRRLGMMIGMAAGAVVMLTIGLVLGVRTGYASAEGLDERQRDATPHSPLDILRAVPVRSALSVLTCGQTAAAPKVAPIQKGIPLIDLPPASARAAETFGAILGIHQASDGKVLVNDAVRRQIKLFDSTLATATIVRDSAPGSAASYGPRPAPLIPYLGDSSLFADWNSRTMLVLDPHGQVAHALALPDPRNMVSINNGYAAVDPKGHLILRGPRQQVRTTPAPPIDYADSLMVLRLDLDLRRTDTIGAVSRPLMKVVTEKSSDGKTSTIYALDPLQSDDDWAVMSDGTVAFVRGHDYHIDWLHPDGSLTSTAKLPFTWKRLTDDDKTRLADSVRARAESAARERVSVGRDLAASAMRSAAEWTAPAAVTAGVAATPVAAAEQAMPRLRKHWQIRGASKSWRARSRRECRSDRVRRGLRSSTSFAATRSSTTRRRFE